MQVINSGDTAWVLVCSALVMLMTPGLALFYGGMVRKKNLLSTIMLSFVVLSIVGIQWILWGYSLSFGPDHWGIIGGFKWLGLYGINQMPNSDYAPTIPYMAFVIFQAMFAIITPALITGALVERIKFSGFIIFIILWATFVYDPIAHWVWGMGGWMKNMGVLDFAGGLVVHISAGISALAAVLVVGKRLGFRKVPMEPNNVPITVLGGSLLWFGWFGFNGGSALAANGLAVNAFVVTMISASSAALVWMLISWIRRKPSVLGFITGAILGEVAITPASGFVGPLSAIAIGAIGAVLGYFTVIFRMKKGIDDSLDVFACHGVGGIWGVFATGIFASRIINSSGANGLIFGNINQLFTQFLAIVVVIIYSFLVTWILAAVVNAIFGMRVKKIEENIGLDISQHAETAYSMF